MDEPALRLLEAFSDELVYPDFLTIGRSEPGIVRVWLSNGYRHLERWFSDTEIMSIVDLHIIAERCLDEWRGGFAKTVTT